MTAASTLTSMRRVPLYTHMHADDPDDAWYWEGAHAILDEAEFMFGQRLTRILDRMSRGWLRRRNAPELAELDACAARVGRAGVYLMNLSFEWSCSVSIKSGAQESVTMRRVFDWGPRPLGPTLCEVRRDAAWPYTALTWPMFAGEATVIAENRFAIALNRAPGPGEWFEYRAKLPLLGRLVDTASFLLSTSTPPAHLLRQIAETAPDAAAAVELLMTSDLCRNGIFMVAGPDIQSSGRVERKGEKASFTLAPCLATNHFQDLSTMGSDDSHGRLAALCAVEDSQALERWLAPPILNDRTRFVSVISMPEGRHFTMAIDNGSVCAIGGDEALKDR